MNTKHLKRLSDIETEHKFDEYFNRVEKCGDMSCLSKKERDEYFSLAELWENDNPATYQANEGA